VVKLVTAVSFFKTLHYLLNKLFALQGEEIFNTYGELANWQLLHMYGFAEPPSHNHYDAVSKIVFIYYISNL